MFERVCCVALALLPFLASPRAETHQDPKASEALVASRAELARLQWLAGTWSGESGGVWHQELWLPAKGGTMLGLHHEVQQGIDRTLTFEYLRVEAREEGVYYVASPMGRTATAFALDEMGEQSVTFANLEHDFPQRIRYERKGDELLARAEGQGSSPLSWRWKLVQ
jgi:hypothetical protein